MRHTFADFDAVERGTGVSTSPQSFDRPQKTDGLPDRYPGAQCDIESYIYMPLLEELKYMPTEKYARARELLAHSEMIGKRYGLYEKTLFQTEVHAMKWDDHSALWSVETSRNDRIKARFIIPAAGPLHRPKLPGVKGIEDFQGHSFHSSRWDYDYTGGTVNSHELTGLKDKRVAIIGTGATAVQIVPNVANYARELYVFQRTPSSIDIRGNRPTDPAWADALKDGWQKERMDNFNLIVNGAVLSEDHVKDGWTDILQKLLARGNATDQSDPEKAAAERQMADFEKMEQIRARCDDVIQDKSVAESLKPWSVRSTHFFVVSRMLISDQVQPALQTPLLSRRVSPRIQQAQRPPHRHQRRRDLPHHPNLHRRQQHRLSDRLHHLLHRLRARHRMVAPQQHPNHRPQQPHHHRHLGRRRPHPTRLDHPRRAQLLLGLHRASRPDAELPARHRRAGRAPRVRRVGGDEAERAHRRADRGGGGGVGADDFAAGGTAGGVFEGVHAGVL